MGLQQVHDINMCPLEVEEHLFNQELFGIASNEFQDTHFNLMKYL